MSGWPEWVEHITAVCGMVPDDRAMLTHWCRLLASAGATPADVIAATDWVALHDPQQWRPNLLAAIQRRLQAQAAGAAPADEPCPDNEACATCAGKDDRGFPFKAVGRLHVPDPDRLAQRRLCLVCCKCPLGRWLAVNVKAVVRGRECRMMSLQDIEMRFEGIDPAPGHKPGWRGYVAWWRQLKQEELGLVVTAKEADRTHGPLVAGLADRWKHRRG